MKKFIYTYIYIENILSNCLKLGSTIIQLQNWVYSLFADIFSQLLS